jgi:hypothetical protein
MNLIEAIKSGKLFRRKSQPNQDFWFRPMDSHSFTQDEILAEDWEVEEIEVTINKKEFHRAWKEALKKNETAFFPPSMQQLASFLEKELGL